MQVVVARQDKSLEVIQLQIGNVTSRLVDPAKKGKFVGLHYRPDNGLLVCSSEGGALQHWSLATLDKSIESENPLEPENSAQLVAPIATAKLDPLSGTTIAYGGKENDLKLWDIEAKKLAWRARNVRSSLSFGTILSERLICLQVPNDFLDMRVPVWIKDVAFFPSTPSKLAIATEYHQV